MAKIFKFLKIDCKVEQNITLKTYLFGFNNALGLNHILLELKKEIFYNWNVNFSVDTFCEHFMVNVRKIMIKENFRWRRWGSRSRVCACLTFRSAPPRHQRKFFCSTFSPNQAILSTCLFSLSFLPPPPNKNCSRYI